MLDHGKEKKEQYISGLRPSHIMGIQPEDLQSTTTEFSHEQIRTHIKYTDKIPRPSHITGMQPEDLQSTTNEFSHEQICTHVKCTDKIPRPSHNIYTRSFFNG
jgi:predicted metal-dependent enzyme (double-stranded beta helix superfamily)